MGVGKCAVQARGTVERAGRAGGVAPRAAEHAQQATTHRYLGAALLGCSCSFTLAVSAGRHGGNPSGRH